MIITIPITVKIQIITTNNIIIIKIIIKNYNNNKN